MLLNDYKFENLNSYLVDLTDVSLFPSSTKKFRSIISTYKHKYMLLDVYLNDIYSNIKVIDDNAIIHDYVCGIINKKTMYEALIYYYECKKISYDDWLLKSDLFDYMDMKKYVYLQTIGGSEI